MLQEAAVERVQVNAVACAPPSREEFRPFLHTSRATVKKQTLKMEIRR
jgi:hypothetical protein